MQVQRSPLTCVTSTADRVGWVADVENVDAKPVISEIGVVTYYLHVLNYTSDAIRAS